MNLSLFRLQKRTSLSHFARRSDSLFVYSNIPTLLQPYSPLDRAGYCRIGKSASSCYGYRIKEAMMVIMDTIQLSQSVYYPDLDSSCRRNLFKSIFIKLDYFEIIITTTYYKISIRQVIIIN